MNFKYSITLDYSPCIREYDFSIIIIPRARKMPIRTFSVQENVAIRFHKTLIICL